MTVAYRGNHVQYHAKVVDNEKNTHYPLLLHGTVNTNFAIFKVMIFYLCRNGEKLSIVRLGLASC